MKVLIACEFSGIVREAFKAKGHDARSCDILPTEIPGQHIQDDVLNHLNEGWDLMIAHPPCTYLSRAAGRVLYNPIRLEKTIKAYDFVMRLWNAPIDKICIENPPGYLCTHWRKWNQKIHPWYFGAGEMKETCLWLKNLNVLTYNKSLYEHPIPESSRIGSDGKIKNKYFVERMTNARDRSRTFKEVAQAMADQWG